MTEAGKLRVIACAIEDDRELPYSDDAAGDLRRIASLLEAIPPKTLEALACGEWQAVPKTADQNMVAAINTHHDGDSNAGDAVWERALATAPKKPEE